jgi:hypothetical protein
MQQVQASLTLITNWNQIANRVPNLSPKTIDLASWNNHPVQPEVDQIINNNLVQLVVSARSHRTPEQVDLLEDMDKPCGQTPAFIHTRMRAPNSLAYVYQHIRS